MSVTLHTAFAATAIRLPRCYRLAADATLHFFFFISDTPFRRLRFAADMFSFDLRYAAIDFHDAFDAAFIDNMPAILSHCHAI